MCSSCEVFDVLSRFPVFQALLENSSMSKVTTVEQLQRCKLWKDEPALSKESKLDLVTKLPTNCVIPDTRSRIPVTFDLFSHFSW